MPNTTAAISRLSRTPAAPSWQRRGRSTATVARKKRTGVPLRIDTRVRGEECVERCTHLRTLADGRGNSLGRSRPHVADRENALHARFQGLATALRLRAGAHEALAVEGD